ncbi:hypothetical protein [Symbioplanes lichenis]|uniref:hypothetical protein n=1 Tax=Symbioplanes lichenis TaxID=1629072 RepID=UPI0027393513|nr:hypothetical protein [Actinoplanes lichenis]
MSDAVVRTPSDPLDALLRLALIGEAELDHVQAVLRDSTVDLAHTGDGDPLLRRPLLRRAADGVLCAMIATSPAHRDPDLAPEWHPVAGADLPALLGDHTDVLVNPAGPAPLRLGAAFFDHHS